VIKDACRVGASQHVVVTSLLVHNLLLNLEKENISVHIGYKDQSPPNTRHP